MTTPNRPPLSGPGSSAAAWRAYAAELTQSPIVSWTNLSRDEIIEQLHSDGVTDEDGNVLPDHKPEGPKPVDSVPAELGEPSELEEDELAPSPKEGQPAAQPTLSGSIDSPEGQSRDDSSPDSSEEAPEVGLVDQPCPICYPAGWPVKQPGAEASCHHGFVIRYGENVEITRERAAELGFLKGK